MPRPRKIGQIQTVEEEIPEIETPQKIKKTAPKRFLLIAVVLLVAGLIFAWVYRRYDLASKGAKNFQNPITDAQKANAKKELQDIMAKVGKHILLPTGEEPALATVNDAAKLAQTQPFYKDAHNGDKVLVYFQSKRAFLYDPNKDMVINVGPLILENKTSSSDSTEQNTTSTP